jgi:hypothetical protein
MNIKALRESRKAYFIFSASIVLHFFSFANELTFGSLEPLFR